MKKNAVITLAIGDNFQKLAEITHPTIERYANKIGADFHVISKKVLSTTTPHWEKFQLLDFLLSYERILYVDTDVLIRKNCPNLFEIVPETHLGLFNEAPFTPNRDYAIARCAEEYGCNDFFWDGKYYNTGVMVLSRYHRFLFRKPQREISNFHEQSYINLEIQRQKPQIFEIDYKFNRMTCIDKFLGKSRFESFIIHYAGVSLFTNGFPIVINDAKHIESLPDDYQAPKHIWIVVQGGLGDQIQAEPTIRFALENIWKNADIRVSTHFPEIFSHLPVICKKHTEQIWEGQDTEPFTRVTLPDPHMPQWKIVSNLMCHTVDFCSMAVLCRTLPNIAKTYKIQINPKALQTIKTLLKNVDAQDCVLIHAGRHWESKSFPEEWWQQIVDGIINNGLTPVFIGKDDETRGVCKLHTHGKAIDLTNLLDLSELIAIISYIPTLISNDSSPVHIAGAFDNWIVLIPTCKHPDHILPYRKGSLYYKTCALYKKLALDDMMTSVAEVKGSTADKLHGSWEIYLPDTNVVIEEIQKITNKDPGTQNVMSF